MKATVVMVKCTVIFPKFVLVAKRAKDRVKRLKFAIKGSPQIAATPDNKYALY